MYFFADTMEKIAAYLKDIDAKDYFRGAKTNIKKAAIELFFDNSTKSFKDLLIDNNRNDPEISHNSHEGYPSLLPLAFGMLDNNSTELEGTLNLIYNENKLWTKYGLRSLS